MAVKVLVLLHMIGIFILAAYGAEILGRLAGVKTEDLSIMFGVGAVLYAFSYYGLRGQK